MMGTLTVREHLEFVAALRLPSSMPESHKRARVNEVMEDLGIHHIANSRIGTTTMRGISGGERRRLAIAAELVTDPPILFLDEVSHVVYHNSSANEWTGQLHRLFLDGNLETTCCEQKAHYCS